MCLVNCPRYPMYLSPSLCSLCLLGLKRHVCVSKLFLVWITPSVWITLKTVTLLNVSVSFPPAQCWQKTWPTKKFNCVFPSICFPCFVQCFCFSPMDHIYAKFTSLARKYLPLLEYAVEFSQLAVLTAVDAAALNSLFWIGVNYHRPVDLPDTIGLSWREAIISCLESVRPQSRTTPDPEPSPPSPRCAKPKPEPTAGGEPMTAATNEPSPTGATELRIAPEPEPHTTSDQVREPATEPAQGTMQGNVRAWRKAPPTAPPLRVSIPWTLGT